MVNPVRTWAALNSSEPSVHASVNMVNSDGLKDGVRALPVFSLSSARPSSPDRRALSTPNCLTIRAKSESVESSSFITKCSISTS